MTGALISIQDVAAALPAVPWFHVVEGKPPVLLDVRNSAIYALEGPLGEQESEQGIDIDVSTVAEEEMSLLHVPPPALPALNEPTALTLNIAQACNFGCSYCYADEGRFGAAARMMTLDVAIEAVSRLLKKSAGRAVSVGFIGGEPLLNRRVLHEVVHFAGREAARLGIPISFGITTNGSLLEPADLDLLRAWPFAVTVSIDGGADVHDKLRRTKGGAATFEAVVGRVRSLLERPGLAKVAARCTVTRRALDVESSLRGIFEAGFCEAGVSPLRTGPDPDLVLREEDWAVLLQAMKAAANSDLDRARNAGQLRFSNFAVALKQLHRGAASPLPCNAASNYVSVSAEGGYYTCHRTVGDPRFFLGGSDGPSPDLRQAFVEARHVDLQQPCRTCWARYLCGGGCHAEVIQADRAGCDYIRGWLEYCIGVYAQMVVERPELLS